MHKMKQGFKCSNYDIIRCLTVFLLSIGADQYFGPLPTFRTKVTPLMMPAMNQKVPATSDELKIILMKIRSLFPIVEMRCSMT